jgi:SAM-dependent methyltransferase
MTDDHDPYARGLRDFAARFEGVAFEDVHAAAMPFVPSRPGAVLDVGAGSGRDAAWLAAAGWDVVAVEPSRELRQLGARLHPDERILWLDDRLPGLDATHRHGLSYDLIWLSAVWMHVAPGDRSRAFRKLVTLLRPGGRIVLSLRHGPADLGRSLHDVDAHEVERLAADHGLQVLLSREQLDSLARPDVHWTVMVLALPDDSTGALPPVRGIILNDRKTSTYKLALLRIVARIADGAAGLAEGDDDHVRIPLGLVALYWIRAFKPLIAHGIPQSGTDRGGSGLGFVEAPFRALDISPLDLRLGTRLEGAEADALRRALADAARTVETMPATYLTFADGSPILPTTFGRVPPPRHELEISPEVLWRYGVMRVPRHLWQALRRLSVWVEPMLIAEWTRLSQRYAELRGRELPTDTVARALRWFDPGRETERARRRAFALLEHGRSIHCVWSGRRLDERSLDIDHCLPWSAWPCDDLWNLMPAHRRVNQHEKRHRIVSGELLRRAEAPIAEWWRDAYLTEVPDVMPTRFWQEARGTLPLAGDDARLGDLLGAIELQRRRIKHDQQLEEWGGAG